MTTEDIKNAVCDKLGTPLEVLNSKSHDGKVKRAQCIAVYIAHEIASIPYDDISTSFGKKDNAWAIFMNKTASKSMDAYAGFATEVNAISTLFAKPNRR